MNIDTIEKEIHACYREYKKYLRLYAIQLSNNEFDSESAAIKSMREVVEQDLTLMVQLLDFTANNLEKLTTAIGFSEKGGVLI